MVLFIFWQQSLGETMPRLLIVMEQKKCKKSKKYKMFWLFSYFSTYNLEALCCSKKFDILLNN